MEQLRAFIRESVEEHIISLDRNNPKDLIGNANSTILLYTHHPFFNPYFLKGTAADTFFIKKNKSEIIFYSL
jgi:hypothetical protein